MGLPIVLPVGDMEFATCRGRDTLSPGVAESSACRGVGAHGWLSSLYSRRCDEHKEVRSESACSLGHSINGGLRAAIAIWPSVSTFKMLVAAMTAAFAFTITVHSLVIYMYVRAAWRAHLVDLYLPTLVGEVNA